METAAAKYPVEEYKGAVVRGTLLTFGRAIMDYHDVFDLEEDERKRLI